MIIHYTPKLSEQIRNFFEVEKLPKELLDKLNHLRKTCTYRPDLEFYEVEDGFAFIVVQMAIARIPTGLQPIIAFDHSCQAANVVRRRIAAHKADTGYIVFVAIYQRQQHIATELRTNILLQLPAVAAGATVRAVR